MTNFDTEQIANRLKQNANLLRIEHNGNTRIWFSNDIPAELPIGSKTQILFTENVPLPHDHYRVIANSLTGWLIYWKYLGPKCMAAGAFISLSPLNSGKPIVTIELTETESNFTESQETFWVYGFESKDYVDYF